MLIYITIIVLVFNLINIFLIKPRKIIPFFTILFYWLIYFGNNNNPDYVNYKNIYLTQSSPDIGFNFLSQVFNFIGFDYTLFLATISLFCFYLMYSTIIKTVDKPSYLLILYFFYPFIIDVIQLRNFIIMALLIYAFPNLLNNSKSGNFKYIFILLVASTIQITALVYIPFVFLKDIIFNKKKLIFFFIALILIIIFSLNPTLLSFIGNYAVEITGEARLVNALQVKTNKGFIIPWIITILNFFNIYFSYNFVIRSTKKIETKDKQLLSLVLSFSVYSLLFLPFYVFNLEFMRFLRNMYIIFYLFIIVCNKYAIKKSKGKYLYNAILIVLVFFNFNFEILSVGRRGLEHIFNPVFYNNFLFRR